MLPVKHTVIYTFFAITSVQNTCFCSVFNALASKNPAKSCYVQCFFHFWPFFHCRKATKMTQNSISIPSCAQTPKNPRKMSKTPPNSIADLPEKKCAESFHFPLSTSGRFPWRSWDSDCLQTRPFEEVSWCDLAPPPPGDVASTVRFSGMVDV